MDVPAEAESTAAVEADVLELKRECHKSSPDLSLLCQMLDRTFAYRRSRIYNPELSVADVLSEYPALRLRSCVSCACYLEMRNDFDEFHNV